MPSFSKQETVMFDQVFDKFEDGLVMSNLFSKYTMDNVTAERSGNTIWRPMPYIVQSYTGIDQSANFNRQYTQLSVPLTLGFNHVVPMTLSATELRDAMQKGNLGEAAMQRLASDVNMSCSNLAALTGTVVVKRTAAATGFDDIAQCDDAFNRLGVQNDSRYAMIVSNHYNSMASNLATRVLDNSKSLSAYEKAYVGPAAGFELYKGDYGYRLLGATATGVTITAANQRYIPKATSTASTGEISNVDNRYQTIGITVAGSTVKVGDAFTIAGVNEVHHITKADTGVPKTFRIHSIVTGAGGTGTVQISPPIISADSSPTDAELQYKNVTAAPAAGAAVTFLNTTSSVVNPFWQGDAFEIAPGEYKPDTDSGMAVMKGVTSQGVTVTMTRQGSIGDLSTKYRWDVFYGLINKQPQRTGVILFGQA